jgi:hypothetical protein
VVLRLVVVVVVGYRCIMVLMRSWAVMVLRMIVPEILVHVERRPHGRRDDQGLNKRACDEATHRDESTMWKTWKTSHRSGSSMSARIGIQFSF